MLLKRPIHSKCNLLKPSLTKMLAHKQSVPKLEDGGIPEGSKVLVRDFRHNLKWKEGVVRERKGPLSYQVDVDGITVKLHQDQLLPIPDGNHPQAHTELEHQETQNETLESEEDISVPVITTDTIFLLNICICIIVKMFWLFWWYPSGNSEKGNWGLYSAKPDNDLITVCFRILP